MKDSESLAAQLLEAEESLRTTLEQACATNLSRADTGELIRVEEMLAIASEAAKKAISIRRRRRHEHAPSPDDSRTGESREFTDAGGIRWTAWSVHPTSDDVEKNAKLLGDYREGWIAFESNTGKRRLRPIPVRWSTLDEQGLRDLLARAKDVPTRRLGERP